MGDGDEPSDTLRERSNESRVKLWLLQNANRRVVTGILLGGFFLLLLGLGALYPGAERALRSTSSVNYAFQAFITATITGVTLVLTLNQLVLSQELGAAGDQRDRMEGAMEFREDVAAAVAAPVSPARPSQFLMSLVEMSGKQADGLRDAVDDDGELGDVVDDLVGSLTENADATSDSLEGAQFGRFEVVSAALNFNYSWKVFTARRIREDYEDELGEEARAALDELIETLTLFGPAREHFKTLYFQWELINLSRAIMAAALPALAVSAYMVLFFNSGPLPVSVGGVGGTVIAVSFAATLASLPFIVLLAYIVRIATVTRQTLSIGPFILRDTDQVEQVEWDR